MATNKPRVVIDTNIFISAIIRGGTPYKLLKAWEEDKISLLISENIFQEIEEVLNRKKINQKYQLKKQEIQLVLEGIKLNAVFVRPLEESGLPIHCRDQKDDKLLACALGGNATHLITGDKDLLMLHRNKKLKKLVILTVADFLLNNNGTI